MPDIMTTDRRKDLHTAITELILFLKGDGTVSSVQKMTGIHRNMLTAIFEVYDAQKRGEVIRTKSESKPRIKNLFWGTNSLITVADKLGIPLSELIRAAEDVQDGLPPWFQRRISRDVASCSTAELGHILLETLGCFTYADPFPEAEKNERVYRRKGFYAGPTFESIFMMESYDEDECNELEKIAIMIVESGELKEFTEEYRLKEITSKESFMIMKKAINLVRKQCHLESRINHHQLFDFRKGVVGAIQYSWNQRKSERPQS